jgi:hypothetical protein
MAMTKPEVPVAVERCHALLRWLLPIIDRLPRSRRYGLGSLMEARLLGVLEHLVSASYLRDKRALLIEANRQLSVVRHLWRLCLELGLIGNARYQHGAELMVELGRQIGGWQRHAATPS